MADSSSKPCLLLFLSFYLLPLTVFLASSSASDVASLLAFKSNISDDPLSLLSNWNSSFPLCQWTGVACNNASRVIRLNLSNGNLSGTITPQLGNLAVLTHLNLSLNNISGIIPPQLGELKALTYLDFQNNQLQGVLPPQLGDCSALAWLNLSQNQLSGKIPAELGNLTELRDLRLPTNRLIGGIPPQLGDLKSLEQLSLYENALNGSLPPELGGLQNLTKLFLMRNQLSGTIPVSLSQLSNLIQFRIETNSVEGPIPYQLGNLKHLVSLSLYDNKIHGIIPPELAGLESLVELGLSNNSLTGSIPAVLGGLKNLSLFMVNINYLNGTIPPHLGNLSNLQKLYVSNNSLSGEIPKELAKLQNLQYFICYSNNLHGSLPPELGQLKKLLQLYLGTNSFAGTIPAEFGNMESLQELELRFGGNMDGTIPPSLGNLTNLTYLDLSNNFFSGEVPSFLARCTQLQWIKLGNNSFSGMIPREYSSLGLLHTLSLTRNNIKGPVPASFANHTTIVVIDLQHNQLSGNLPDSWAKNVNLKVLLLCYNKLGPVLPDWLWSLPSLQILCLSNNQFSSAIPPSIDQMKSLQSTRTRNQEILWNDNIEFEAKSRILNLKYLPAGTTSLDLSGNKLFDKLPEELGSLDRLYYLNLSRNNLKGPIPTNFGNLSSLESLDLSINSLTGRIPIQLTYMTSLAYLNLSYNQLSGSIPTGAQFSTFNNLSYLGNSNLCGDPLPVSCSEVNAQTPSAAGFGGGNRFDGRHWIPVGVGAFAALAVLGAGLFLYLRRTSRERESVETREEPKIQLFGGDLNVTIEDLYDSTDGFDESNIIGRGGSSTVYKGVLSDHLIIAIKRFNTLKDAEVRNVFFAECATLSQIRHRNLLRLLGTCSTLDMKALLLEFMSNGSLHDHLHQNQTCRLSWQLRLKIARGVAQGLNYLHRESGKGKVLHCDLKPANILLDDDFEPHISDFGLAKMLVAGKEGATVTSGMKGTIGYMAPESGRLEKLTEKADVFSYGIILLEMVTGQSPTGSQFMDGSTLPQWVRRAYPDNLQEVLDPELRMVEMQDEIQQLVTVGLRCTFDKPKLRPSMKEVLDMLISLSHQPCQFISAFPSWNHLSMTKHEKLYFPDGPPQEEEVEDSSVSSYDFSHSDAIQTDGLLL